MRTTRIIPYTMIAGLLCASLAQAADHIDGPVAISDPTADIIDFYAFTSPNRPEHVVLIMDVHPLAGAASRFSDRVTYTFRVRSLFRTWSGPDRNVRCTFEGVEQQRVTCTSPSGLTTSASLNDVSGGYDQAGNPASGMRVFAGLRSDPFFIDAVGVGRTFATGIPSFTGVNTVQGANALSLVVELPALPEFQDQLLAVAAETSTSAGRIDRMGMPEVTNFMLRDSAKKDLYNAEDTFNVSSTNFASYRISFDTNLKSMDAIDKANDWTPTGGAHPWIFHIAEDYLLVDVSKPCDVDTDSYLDIERTAFGYSAHQTCGGRTPNDDVIDDTLTWLVNGPYKPEPRVSDGVNNATKAATNVFPYLASPN